VYQKIIKSPLGYLEISSTNHHIVGVKFPVRAKKELERDYPAVLNQCEDQLNEYFQGRREVFDLPLLLEGSVFQKRVWAQLLEIPFGKTISYQDLALKVGNRNAARAVGMANSKNPIPIIVACHRVIGKGGEIVGYSPGISYKYWLLSHEGVRS
jgi:methylated-DNA-[protein]-cysteine S-methyltransferase